MIRFIDLPTQYFCNNDPDELDDMPCWAFIDTTTDRFLENDMGSHLFDDDAIDIHPQAERLRRLVPRQVNLSSPLAHAIIDMEGQGLRDGPSTVAWEALVAKAEKAVGRKV